MTTLTLILIAAAAGFGVATLLKAPSMPFLMLAGVGLGLSGLLESREAVTNTMVLGLTVLVFFLGVELDIKRVGTRWRAALVVGLVQFVLLGGIALSAALVIGFGLRGSLAIALALTASSTLVGVSMLRRRARIFEPQGRLVIGVLLVQDALVLLLLPVLLASTPGEAGLGVLATFGMLAMAAVFLRWLGPWMLLKLRPDEETLLLITLSILFGFAGLAHAMGLPIVTGAFFAGVSLSGFPVRDVVRGQVASLNDFFMAIFFVALGVLVEFVDVQQLALNAVLLVGVLLVTPPVITVVARRMGLTTRASIESAHLLSQSGEFGVLVALLATQAGYLDATGFATIVLLAMITMGITSTTASDSIIWGVMRLLPRPRFKLESDEEERKRLIFIGCAWHTRSILPTLASRGREVVAVDEDSAVIDRLRREGINAVNADGADPWVLRKIDARHAGVIVSTMRRYRDNEQLLRFIKDGKVVVRTFAHEEGERLESRGAKVVVESDAALDEFLTWYDGDFSRRPDAGGSGHAGKQDSEPDAPRQDAGGA